jgi:hypothetical protein
MAPPSLAGLSHMSLVDLYASTPSSSGLSRGSATGRSATTDVETAVGSVLSKTRQPRQILGTSPRMTAEQAYLSAPSSCPHMRLPCPSPEPSSISPHRRNRDRTGRRRRLRHRVRRRIGAWERLRRNGLRRDRLRILLIAGVQHFVSLRALVPSPFQDRGVVPQPFGPPLVPRREAAPCPCSTGPAQLSVARKYLCYEKNVPRQRSAMFVRHS